MGTFSRKPKTKHGDANSMWLATMIALVLAGLFSLALATGCASQSSPSADSAETEQAFEEAAEQNDEAADGSQSPADSEEAADAESDSSSGRPSDEEVVQYYEWVDTTLCNALNNLAGDGVIARPPSDGEYLQDAFEYSNSHIAFLDEEAGEELTGSYSLPAGKVIIASYNPYEGSTHALEAFYANGDWGPDDHGDPPLFYPQSMFGTLDMYQMQDALTDVPSDTFANSTDECDYLIVFDGVESSIEEDYYVGGWDRVSVTTIALVIDVKQGKVVHIENVGVDTPASYQATSTTGEMLRDELAVYLHGLLLDRSDS